MSTMEIKGNLHELIVKLNNKDLLIKAREILNDFVSQEESQENGWDELPLDKKMELDQALIDIEDKKNLVTNEEVFKKYDKWLKK